MPRSIYVLILNFCFFGIAFCTSDFLQQLQETNNKVVTLFSHRDNLKQCLGDLIRNEKKAIQIAAYNLTSQDIVGQLLNAQKRKIAIEVITGLEGLHCYGQQITQLWQSGIPVYVTDSNSTSMHHKYVIFSHNVGSRPAVWTGSGNITERGLTKNYENIVVLREAHAIENYRYDFDWLKKRIQQQPRSTIKLTSCISARGCLLVTLVRGMISLIK